MEENKSNALRQIVIAVIAIGVTALVSNQLLGSKEEIVANEIQENIKLIKTQKVELTSYSLSIPVYGVLTSTEEIDLFPEVNGILISQNFKEGLRFNKGEAIAIIDSKELKSNLKGLKSSFLNLLATVVSDLKFDFPNDYQAWEVFLGQIEFDKNLPALPEVKDVKMKKYLSGKNIYAQYFNIEAQQDRLSKYVITAPFTGVLSEALVKKGTVIRPGQKIGKLVSVNDFELEANISLSEGNQVKNGSEVVFTSEDVSGSWIGQVRRVNYSVDKATQNLSLFIGIQSFELYNGMYLSGELKQGSSEESFMLERNLIEDNQVFLVKDGTLVQKQVQVIQIKGEMAIVTGLSNGDVVLADVVKGAYEGMKVRSQN